MLKKTIPILSIFAAVILLLLTVKAFTNLNTAASSQNPIDSIQQQKQTIIGYIECANSVSAVAAFEKLIADYNNNDLIVSAVYDIAEKYREKSQYKSAVSAYKYIVDNFPLSSQAVWAQRGLVVSTIALGNTNSAQVETQNLINNYNNDPNIAQAVFEIADAYYWFKKNDDARLLYQKVIDTWPNAEHAMWAQMGWAISYIADGNDIAAQAATDKLIGNYGDNKKLPEALFYIAGRYDYAKKYDKGQDIYRYIIDKFPENEWSKNSQFESAKAAIYPYLDAADELHALTAIDNLIASYKDKPDLPAIVYDFAARVDSQNKYEPKGLTAAVFSKVIEKFPQSPQVANARMAIKRIDLIKVIECTNDFNDISKIIDSFIDDFNGCPGLAEQVFLAGESFYNRIHIFKNQGLKDEADEYSNKAKTIWDKITQRLPACAVTPRAYHFAGECCRILGDYKKALPYYQIVVSQWPEYEYSWNLQFLVGHCYEQMKYFKLVDRDTANKEMKSAYLKVIEKYPNSMAAKGAAALLENMREHEDEEAYLNRMEEEE
jgi:TolA-binding protein